MQLRPLAPGDIPAAVALSRACREKPAEQVGNPAWLTEADFYEETARWDVPPGERFLVAEATDGTLAGYVGLEVVRDDALLHGPIVAPAYRRRGLGKLLLQAALDQAARLGTETVNHTVGDGNQRAYFLLSAHGFVPARSSAGILLMDIRPTDLQVPPPVPGATCELAGADDVRGIYMMYQQCFPGDYATEGSIRAWCASPSARVFTIRLGRQLAGFTGIDLRPPILHHVGIAPSFRRQGLATRLCTHTLQECWRLVGPRPVGLAVRADNSAAVALCGRLGCRPPAHLRLFSRPAPTRNE